jgi:uncharacterized protein YggU (UPF0235/DUF167 family)
MIGMYLKVFVTPGARKEKIEVRSLGKPEAEASTLLICVREPASGNRANDRVRELIALREGVAVAQVRILTGHHSRAKMVSITR